MDCPRSVMSWVSWVLVTITAVFLPVDGLNESWHLMERREVGRNVARGLSEETCSPAAADSVLSCGIWWLTNCTALEALPACPAECPYRAASPVLGCVFSCVPAENCSLANGDLALPDKESLFCQHCSVTACRICSDVSTCQSCKDNFGLANSSDLMQCVYTLNEASQLKWIMTPTAASFFFIMLFTALLLLVVSIIVKLCMKDWPQNQQYVMRGIRHRRQVKVHAWGSADDAHVDDDELTVFGRLVGLRENLHSKDIIGIGFAFFYTDILFACVWTGCALLVVLGAKYVALAERPAGKDIWTFLGTLMTPAAANQAANGLIACKSSDDQSLEDFQEAYLRNSFVALWGFYFVSIVASFYRIYRQRISYRKFYAESKPLFTHVVMLHGFPPGAVSEKDIMEKCENHFGVRMVGVSILYDTHKVSAELEEILDHHLFDAEYTFEVGPRDKQYTYFEMCSEYFKQHVQGWFTNGKVQNSGSVACVLNTQQDAEHLFQTHAEKPLLWEGKKLWLEGIEHEPTMVVWENIRSTSFHGQFLGERVRLYGSIFMACFCCLIFMIFVAVICYGPLAWYNALHAFGTGTAADAGVRTLLGSLVGIANAFMIPALINFAKLAKLVRRDREEVLICAMVTVFFVLNTLFNLFWIPFDIQLNGGWKGNQLTHLFRTRHGSRNVMRQVAHLGRDVEDLDGMILLEKTVAKVQHSLEGGMFAMFAFLPIVLFALPYMGGILTLKMGRSDMRLGQVERTLQPLDMNLGVDMAGLIANSIICVSGFLLMSSRIWRFMSILLLWTVLYYWFCRYIHLRGFKSAFYHSKNLAECFNVFWQMVIALISAAACRHGYHMELCHWRYTFVAPALHICLFMPLVHYLDSQPLTILSEDTYDKIASQKAYNWFNTNPIMVLKSTLEFDDLPKSNIQDRLVYFSMGKQYLQASMSNMIGAKGAFRRIADHQWTEAELYVENAGKLLGQGLTKAAGGVRRMTMHMSSRSNTNGTSTNSSLNTFVPLMSSDELDILDPVDELHGANGNIEPLMVP